MSFLHAQMPTPRHLKPKSLIERFLFWTGAVVIALAVILFVKLCAASSNFFRTLYAFSPYLPLLATPAGFALVVWATRRFFSGAEDSGIPFTIAAISKPEIADRSSLFPLRMTFAKIFFTALGLCFGASVGPEGPSVQIGSSIMYSIGKRFSFSTPQLKRTLVLAGGAAGLAAAFNTPLAGILFAIEELSRSFETKSSGTVLTAVIISGIVSIAALGNYTYFGQTTVALSLMQAARPILLCGLVCGLLGGLFAHSLLFFAHGLHSRIGQTMTKYPPLFAAGCGLLIAVLGFASHGAIFGTGYVEAKSLIEGTASVPAFFGLMKLLATALTYISGVPGGLFAPTLAAGAGLGNSLAPWLPEAPAAAIIILGMAATFTGVIQTPITATIIMMEMTSDSSLTLPLMITTFLAYGVSRVVCPTPFYQSLATLFLEKHLRQNERPTEQSKPSDSVALP